MRSVWGAGSVVLASFVAVLGLAPSCAQAQSIQEQQFEQRGLTTTPSAGNWEESNWNVNVGAGIAVAPTYLGSKEYRIRPIPIFSIAYRDLVFIGPTGLSVNLINVNGFHAGVALGYLGGRSQGDDSRLDGLGDIQASVTTGVFADYRIGSFGFSGTIRQSVTHTSNGFLGSIQLDYHIPPVFGERVKMTIGPDLEFADGQYNQTWYGVSSVQSGQSHLSAFNAGGGINDVGLHVSLTYQYSANILLRAFASAKDLTGAAANSPITEDKTQFLFGFGAAYHF